MPPAAHDRRPRQTRPRAASGCARGRATGSWRSRTATPAGCQAHSCRGTGRRAGTSQTRGPRPPPRHPAGGRGSGGPTRTGQRRARGSPFAPTTPQRPQEFPARSRSAAHGARRDRVGEHPVQWPWHVRKVECVDEYRRVLDLAPAAGAHEAPQLRLDAAGALRGLVLEGPEAPELALGLDDPLDAGGAEAADQLVLEVGVTDVEARRLKPDPLDGAAEVALLGGIAEAGDADALRHERLEASPDVPGSADRDHGNPFGREVVAPPG